jgi:GAF domain-containing protein
LSEAAANNFVQQVSKRSLERWIIDHQQAAIVFDTTTDSRWETLPETAEGRPVRSAVGVPLTGLREGFRGAIVLAQPTAHHFDDDHIAILRLVSLFLAIAFDNARLYEQTQQTLAELDDVNRRLTGDTWGTYLQHKSRASVIWVSKAGNLDRLSQPDVEQTLATNKISIQPLAGGNTTQVIVPLTLRGQPIGALQMHTPADAWNDDLQTIVTNIAGHIVQAVENTRLIEVTEERFARERALSESTDKIRRRTDVERILQTAAEELARRLQAARVAVRLEPDGGSAHVDANGDKRSNQS